MSRFARQMLGVSIREAARQIGISDTAIRKAIKAGRCQTLADGSVDVDAVRAGMASTADPLRGGQRHAGVFGELPMGPAVTASVQTPAPAASQPAPAAGQDKMPAHGPLLAARTLTEQTRAERDQIELAKLKNQVAEVEPMTRAVYDSMIEARQALQALPDRLTPLVTPETDPGKVFGVISAEVNRICEGLQASLTQRAKLSETVLA